MGEITGIAWTKHTHNEWIGCTEAGPGCDTCYARELDRKYQFGVPGPERAPGIAATAPHWGVGAPRHRTAEANRAKPLKYNRDAEAAGKPAMVFCNSLSDVFDNEVPQEWREALFATWRATPWLRWQVLTKRVPNIRKMLPADWGDGYPNVGLIATTVNQVEFERDAPRLRAIPCRWYGFSMEPQIGPIRPWLEYVQGDRSVWFITGGESAQGSVKNPALHPVTREPMQPREYDPEWIGDLLDCAVTCPNVSVFVKQTGARPKGLLRPRDGAGANMADWPAWMRVRNFPPELTQ